MTKQVTIGIDLGTTNSVVAIVDANERPVAIINKSDKTVTPSVVWIDQGRVIVGEEAKDEMRLRGDRVASFFKRKMGDPDFRFEVDGREFSAIDLSAYVLRSLKEDAERALGVPVTNAVITVPAYFHDPERKATIEAGKQAGLNVLQLINEPTAAAIAYGWGARREIPTQSLGASSPKVNKHVLVYDLGGGTFDVSLLEISEIETRVLTTAGDAELGGKDWDARIVDFLDSAFEAEHGFAPRQENESIGDVWVAAEDLKKALTDRQNANASLSIGGERGRYALTRKQFNNLTHDLVQRTLDMVGEVLQTAGVQAKDVDEVLLVGGSTRMPMIRETLKAHFGREPAQRVNVDEAVALGAALCAHAHQISEPFVGLDAMKALQLQGMGLMLGPTRVTDVTPHSLGMIAVNESNTAYLNTIILRKDLPIPRRDSRPYQHYTRANSDNPLEIFMTQGEREEVDSVVYLGRYVIPTIPHDPTGAALVNIDYMYDLSGSVNVTARLLPSNQELPIVVEKIPNDVPTRFLQSPPRKVFPHVTVYLAFDLSGSMSGSPLTAAQVAGHEFVSHLDLSHCSVGVIAVADSTNIVLKASQNGRKIAKAIDSLYIGLVGYGNDDDPFDDAMRALLKVEGSRILVALADGVWSYQDKAIKRAKALHAEGIDVIAIGFGHADKQFLRAIASSDEGSFFTSLSDLSQTFSSIAQVITQNQGGSTQASAYAKASGGLLSMFGNRDKRM
jgi:molecular chaperone DnaK (HSP70)